MSAKVGHPTRSTNREADERFFHINTGELPVGRGRTVQRITAFTRTTPGGTFVSFAECDSRDQFCKKVGRNVARRKWFAGKRYPIRNKPSYEAVVDSLAEISNGN